MRKFAELFKKYRLKAEFETFAYFSNALSEKGYFYEESIFSHWQKGSRIPSNRKLLISIIEIFVERKAITSLNEANELLSSTGQGYLTEKESEKLHIKGMIRSPFQVPSEMVHFAGRNDVIKKIIKEINHQNVFLIYGAPGVGKTALAIKLGHLLRDKFPDGVLWYKVDSSNVMDILLSIARLFGEDISYIKDLQVRASIVRTLLENKRVLIIFDNVTNKDNLSLLLPNTTSSSVIFSSQENLGNIINHCVRIKLQAFAKDEVLELFTTVFDKKSIIKNKKLILAIGDKLGNLPLAIHIAAHIIATYSKNIESSLEKYLSQLDEDNFDLQTLAYEDKNLLKAIEIGFDLLNNRTKEVFISLGVFEGKDFSLAAVASINNLSALETRKILRHLVNISFIEESKIDRYMIHPMLKFFARKHMDNTQFYLRAAFYYEQLLNQAKEINSYKPLSSETENIIYVFKKCYDAGYWDQIITLWNPIEKLLSDTNEIKKLRSLTNTIDTAPAINNIQKILTGYLIILIAFWVFLFISGAKTSFWNYFYGFIYSIIPFVGGIIGIIRSKLWGFFKTNIGKSIFFLSLGLFGWGSGNMVWAYYNFFVHVDVPYPSLADIFYIPSYSSWVIGIIYLARATGARFSFINKVNKVFFLTVPIIINIVSYYYWFFVLKQEISSESTLRVFLDAIYPTFDVIILTIALIILILSRNFLRGKYKLSIFGILLGFMFIYAGDFLLSYSTSVNTYYNGYLGDFIFTIGTYLLLWGTLSFYLIPKK